MPNVLSQLTKGEQTRLLEELNYMNLQEIHGFCSGHGIPFKVMAEHSDGTVRATKDTDRKPIVLARVRRYLTTGDVGQPARIPDEGQDRGTPSADAGVRLPDGPQAPARHQRLESPAQRQGKVGSEDTGPNRSCSSGGRAPALPVINCSQDCTPEVATIALRVRSTDRTFCM